MYQVWATGWGLVGTYGDQEAALAHAREDARDYRRIHEVVSVRDGVVVARIEPRRY